MIGLCSGGDKGFMIDNEYLIYSGWPNITISKVSYEGVGTNDNESIPPHERILITNYPNPFSSNNLRNSGTTIKYSLPDNGEVIVSLYNIKGQLVKTLVNERQEKGEHQIHWDGLNYSNQAVASGMYFVKCSLNKNISSIHKILKIK